MQVLRPRGPLSRTCRPPGPARRAGEAGIRQDRRREGQPDGKPGPAGARTATSFDLPHPPGCDPGRGDLARPGRREADPLRRVHLPARAVRALPPARRLGPERVLGPEGGRRVRGHAQPGHGEAVLRGEGSHGGEPLPGVSPEPFLYRLRHLHLPGQAEEPCDGGGDPGHQEQLRRDAHVPLLAS